MNRVPTNPRHDVINLLYKTAIAEAMKNQTRGMSLIELLKDNSIIMLPLCRTFERANVIDSRIIPKNETENACIYLYYKAYRLKDLLSLFLAKDK
jgi:hypothetical protein